MDFAQPQNDPRAQRRANRVLSGIVGALSLTVLLCLVVIRPRPRRHQGSIEDAGA